MKQPSVLADLVTLTKPRIISLLLVTTVAPMFMTDRGLPSPMLVVWVLIGGYLMAGGANAINMWFDRDIDDRMTRTRLRPIPAGRLTPAQGLLFGVSLGAIAFWIFWTPGESAERLARIRWAAVLRPDLHHAAQAEHRAEHRHRRRCRCISAAGGLGRDDRGARSRRHLPFAIIFYWTPPHFWALALIKQGEYAKAGVPMMPVVKGEERTKWEMLIYTLLLLPLTVMPAVFGALGPFYAVAAVLLGGRLLWYCIALLREAGVTPTAWKMYRYSLLYLFLLFLAMGIDRYLPRAAREAAPDVVILRQNDEAAAQAAKSAGLELPLAH